MQAGPAEVVGSGIMIVEQCVSTVQGLYAAGDSADQTNCVHGAVTGGYAVGREVARYALATELQPIDQGQGAAEKKRAPRLSLEVLME